MLEYERPASVMGPLGRITIDDLPSSSTAHWVGRRKAELLAAIDGGLLSEREACERYRLSAEELAAWRRSVDRAGIPGLRVTRIQEYRNRLVK
ncbi:CtrA inhibitor SciP [Sphingopyxis sp. 22461]|uniref:CtrA inhibitor SciP n=1 Tax=Sphingopyxis sp. 22461 TaxID=3453923 RepID=UPI003F861BE5